MLTYILNAEMGYSTMEGDTVICLNFDSFGKRKGMHRVKHIKISALVHNTVCYHK